MDEMVERVVRLMDRYYVGAPGGGRWRVYDRDKDHEIRFRCRSRQDAQQLCCEANAQAVIEAIRDRTEPVSVAGHLEDEYPVASDGVWRKMIDAALTS